MIRWVGGGLVATLLAATWWELLFLPLGASHDGRINARFGLHVRNFLDHGWAGSDYLASMAPFAPEPYTHHPPLLNLMQAAVASTLGQGEWQLHLIGYLAGLGTVAGLLWLARELDLGAGGSVVALVLVVTTPMFWIYARLGLGVSIVVVLLCVWHRQLRSQGGAGWPVALSGLAALSSWWGAASVIWLYVTNRSNHAGRKAARACLLAGVGAVIAVLMWAATVGDASELARHTTARLVWPPLEALWANLRWYYQTLFPWWIRWTILPALVVALVDRRTRPAAGVITAALASWTLVTPDAAHIHDFWTYPLIVPVFLGLAVIADRVLGRLDMRTEATVAGLILAVVATSGLVRMGPYRDAYFRAPSDAGAVLREVEPPPGQVTAWVVEGVDPVPRWVSYYWDLPVVEVNLDNYQEVGPNDLMLVRLDRAPAWMERAGSPAVQLQQGRYALVGGADLSQPSP